MGDERGRATGEAEGVGCGALAWNIVAGSVSDRRAFVSWATSGAGPQAKPKASAVGHFLASVQDSLARNSRSWSDSPVQALCRTCAMIGIGTTTAGTKLVPLASALTRPA